MAFKEDLDEGKKDGGFGMDLFTAASVGDLNHIMTLDTPLESTNQSKWTALMYASYYDHMELVNFLVLRGVPVIGTQSDIGRTPLMLAAMSGNLSICRYLLRKFGPDIVEERDKLGLTPLFLAVACNQETAVQVLLEANANPNVTENIQGYSPLMTCCLRDNICTRRIAGLLIQYNANVGYNNILGENARNLAKKLGNDSFLCILNKTSKMPEGISILDGPGKLAQKLMMKQQEPPAPVTDLESFLVSAGLQQSGYLDLLKEKRVTLDALLKCTDQDLKDMGISKMGPRKKMLLAIGNLKGGIQEINN